MKTENEVFTPIVIEDLKSIHKATKDVDALITPANQMKTNFEKLFGYFNLDDLVLFMNSENKPLWIAEKYIEVNKIQTNSMSIEKIIELGLIKLPDIQPLINAANIYQRLFEGGSAAMFVNHIRELYSNESNEFVEIFKMQDLVILDRMYVMYKTVTTNEDENNYIIHLKNTANNLMTLLNSLKVIKPMEIPQSIFKVSFDGSNWIVEPHQKVLINYRKRKV